MAITVTRQKDGSMKTTKRTGFDSVSHKFGNALEKIKSTAKKVVTRPARAAASKRKGDAQKEIKDIERGFGSVDKYVEFNPSFAERAKKLRENAGY